MTLHHTEQDFKGEENQGHEIKGTGKGPRKRIRGKEGWDRNRKK